MVRSPGDTTKSSHKIRVTMNSVKVLLTICFYVMIFETDAVQRFHRKPHNWYNAIDELSDAIRIHHRNKAFKFDISGPRNSYIKRKLTSFANKAYVAPGPSRFSKRCFPDGCGFSPVTSLPWWPPAFDPQWPEYGLGMDGYGYSVPDPYGWNGCGTCNQPFPYFPSPWGMWFCCGGESQKPTEAPTSQTTKGITKAPSTQPTPSATRTQAPTRSKTSGATSPASEGQPTIGAQTSPVTKATSGTTQGPTTKDDASKTAAKPLAVHRPASSYNDLRKYKMRLLKQGLRRKGNKNGVVIVM